MHTPADKRIVFTFVSHPTRDLKLRWTARLEFPPASSAKSILPITIVDGEECPVCEGVFEFAGRRLKVKEGCASIAYDEFIRGKHEKALWLHRKGVDPIPGGLTFA